MKNSAAKVVHISLIGGLVLVKEGIFNKTVAALGTNEEVGVGSIAAEGNLTVGEERIELSFSLKSDLAALKRLPPEAEAVVADGANVVCKVEACAVLITVAELVPVLPAKIAECDTVGILIPT